MKKIKSIKNLIKMIKSNNGSVMVTVLIAFMFVSILVAIILSSVVVNFKIRAVERNVKDEFYYAEKALNDIYTGIGMECSVMMGDKYNKVLENVGGSYTSYDIEDEKEAMERFSLLFTKELHKKFKAEETNAILEKYITGNRAKLGGTPTVKFYVEQANKTLDEKDIDDLNSNDSADDKYFRNIRYTIIKDVVVESDTDATENKGYSSAIKTDIVIETPRLDFVTVNKKWFDYAVIANDGIEFEGATTINGNTYGGALTPSKISEAVDGANLTGNAKSYSSKEYGGIFIDNCKVSIKGDYIVSGGDIIVSGENANLLLGYDNKTQSEIWFESLLIEQKGKATLNEGTMAYALNDLEIADKSDGSEVVCKGTYYGYNPGTLVTKESIYKEKLPKNPDAKSSKSSAIIVNSSNAKVDMSGVDTLILLGQAYVDHSSKSPTYNVSDFDMKNAYTLESAALKANQEIYLVPTTFLGASNPTEMKNPNPFPDIDSDALKEWAKNCFGEGCLSSTAYNMIAVSNASSIQYAYCYLDFSSDTARFNYLSTIIDAITTPSTDPIVNDIAKKLDKATSLQNSQIIVGTDDSTHVYANNAIIEYKDGHPSIKDNKPGIDRFKGYSVNMYNKYRWLDTYLDPQVSRSLTNIKEELPGLTAEEKNGREVITMNRDFEKTSTADFEDNCLPLSRLVWLCEDEKKNPASGNPPADELPGIHFGGVQNADVSKDSFEDFPGKVIISKNDVNLSLTSTDTYGIPSDGRIFVISAKNVTVPQGANIKGFIYAGKKITFLGGGTGTTRVTFDSTLFERRIEKEIKQLKADLRSPARKSTAYKDYYLISYLLDITPEVKTGETESLISTRTKNPMPYNDLKYYYGSSSGATTAAEINTDYRNFITFENWKNGQIPTN